MSTAQPNTHYTDGVLQRKTKFTTHTYDIETLEDATFFRVHDQGRKDSPPASLVSAASNNRLRRTY